MKDRNKEPKGSWDSKRKKFFGPKEEVIAIAEKHGEKSKDGRRAVNKIQNPRQEHLALAGVEPGEGVYYFQK